MGCCDCLGNCIWITFGGFLSALIWFFIGVLLCLTIIGIPFGRECFKFARLNLAPFGKNLEYKEDNAFKCPQVIGNILWLPFGVVLALIHMLTGAFYVCTIIGVPFGWEHWKLARLAIWPFGAVILHQGEDIPR